MDNPAFMYRVGFGNGVLFAALLFIVLSMLIPPIIRVRYTVANPVNITPAKDADEPETVTETDGD